MKASTSSRTVHVPAAAVESNYIFEHSEALTDRMRAIGPDEVLGKEVVDGSGSRLGEIVDVGLYDHSRVKFLVLQDKARAIKTRRVGVDEIDDVGTDVVRLRVH